MFARALCFPPPFQMGGVHGGPRPAPGGGGAPGGSPLDALASAIGVQGQTVQVPPIMSLPGRCADPTTPHPRALTRLHLCRRDVPLIVVILLGVLTLVVGWQVLAVAAALHVFSGLSDGAARGGAARAGGAAGGAAGGGGGGSGGRPGGRPA